MTFKLSETPKFSAKKFDYCRWFRFSYCAWNVNIWYRLSCRSCLYLTLLRLRNLFCACRATVQKRWRLYMYIPTMLWELITRQFRDIRKPFFCTNNIVHHRLGYFRTFLWFYEPALIFSVELSPLNLRNTKGFTAMGVMPVHYSTVLPICWVLINQFKFQAHCRAIEIWSTIWLKLGSSATHSAGSNKCGQMRQNGELFQLMFNHGAISAQKTTRFNIRILIPALYLLMHYG